MTSEKAMQATMQVGIALMNKNTAEAISIIDTAIAEAVKPLVEALNSISANTCCDKCQEAALVASNALSAHRKQFGEGGR